MFRLMEEIMADLAAMGNKRETVKLRLQTKTNKQRLPIR